MRRIEVCAEDRSKGRKGLSVGTFVRIERTKKKTTGTDRLNLRTYMG